MIVGFLEAIQPAVESPILPRVSKASISTISSNDVELETTLTV